TLDALIIRTNSTGHQLWNKTFGGNQWDHFRSGFVSPDGGFVLVGVTSSYGAGSDDFWIVKTNDIGEHMWNKTFGGLSADYGSSGISCTNGDMMFAGYTLSSGVGQYDMWWIRTDAEGNHLWNYTYGRPEWDEALTILERSNGDYLVSGWLDTMTSACLIRTNEFGEMIWVNEYASGEGYYGSFESMIETSDGGLIAAGLSGTSFDVYGTCDAWICRFPEDGVPIWLEEPADHMAELDQIFRYDVNASDVSGIGQWWLNDTIHFSIDTSGVITNIIQLELDIYNLEINVCDIYGNTLTSAIQVIVEDTAPPSWVVDPINLVLSPESTLNYRLFAWDISGISHWDVNDTINFAVDSIGLITSVTALSLGYYGLRVTVFDNFMNPLSVDLLISVEDLPSPWDDEDFDDIPNYLDWLVDVEVTLTDLPVENWPEDTIYNAYTITPTGGQLTLHNSLDGLVESTFWNCWDPESTAAKAQGYIKQLYVVEMNRDFFVNRIINAGGPLDPLMNLLAACVPGCSDGLVRLAFAQTDHDPFYLRPLSYDWFIQDGYDSMNEEGQPLRYKLTSYSMLMICSHPNRFEERLSSLPSIFPNPFEIFDYVWATIGLFDGTISAETWLDNALSQWVTVTLGIMGKIMSTSLLMEQIVGIAISYLQNVVVAFLELFESLDVDLFVSIDGEVVMGSNSAIMTSSSTSMYGFTSGDTPWFETIIFDADALVGHEVSILIDGSDIPSSSEEMNIHFATVNNGSVISQTNYTGLILLSDQRMETNLEVEIDEFDLPLLDVNLSPLFHSATVNAEVTRGESLEVLVNCTDSNGLDFVQICARNSLFEWINLTATETTNGFYSANIPTDTLEGSEFFIYVRIGDTLGAETIVSIGSVDILDSSTTDTSSGTTTTQHNLQMVYLLAGLSITGIVITILIVYLVKKKDR
ncbi:MAG: hypothetical protein RTV72_15150, partial [Candidatus Thorarchaeota archaeon]